MGGARAVARQPYHSPPPSPPSESPGPEIIDVRIRILFIFRECAANSYTRLRRSLLFYRSATDRSIGKPIALFQFMPESVFVFLPQMTGTVYEIRICVSYFIIYFLFGSYRGKSVDRAKMKLHVNGEYVYSTEQGTSGIVSKAQTFSA